MKHSVLVMDYVATACYAWLTYAKLADPITQLTFTWTERTIEMNFCDGFDAPE